MIISLSDGSAARVVLITYVSRCQGDEKRKLFAGGFSAGCGFGNRSHGPAQQVRG